MAAFTKVAAVSDIPQGSGRAVEVAGRTIAVFNCGGTFLAVDNTCRHQGGPLADGMVNGTSVSCPWHGWEYDLVSGACAMDPAVCVQKFDVKVEGDDILVAV